MFRHKAHVEDKEKYKPSNIVLNKLKIISSKIVNRYRSKRKKKLNDANSYTSRI